MQSDVACGAEGNKVLFGVVAGVAAEFLMMNFEIGYGAARLASPAIAVQHLVAELFVQLGIKPQARTFVECNSRRLLGHLR